MISAGTALPAGNMPAPQQQPQRSLRLESSPAYWARRRRNNEAARRCRERRRMEEVMLELRALELLRENQRLRAALGALCPGYQAADRLFFGFTCTGQTLPQSPQGSRVPYRPWDAQPRAARREVQPLPPVTVPFSALQPGAQQPALCRVTHPSSGESFGPPEPQTHDPLQPLLPESPELSSLPHKLRLKGALAQNCGLLRATHPGGNHEGL